jgi:uncharacterized membrane protein (UPF0127 family)
MRGGSPLFASCGEYAIVEDCIFCSFAKVRRCDKTVFSAPNLCKIPFAMGNIRIVIVFCFLSAGCDADAGKKSTIATPEKAAKTASPVNEVMVAPITADKCPNDPIFGGTKMQTGQVTFPDAPNAPSIVAESAAQDAERERGLMYRTHLAKNAGMLFLPDGPPRVQTFWMKNTCIPLDMLFIDDKGTVVGILENVPPMNLEPRSVHLPSSYVLEVNAGWCKANGVAAGQKVKLPKTTKTGD